MHSRRCCYPSHDCKVDVHRAADCGDQRNALPTSLGISQSSSLLLASCIIAKRMGIMGMLITSNKNRFTSMHASMESVVRRQPALTELADKQPHPLTGFGSCSDNMFFTKLQKLCYLLQPITYAGQNTRHNSGRCHALLADVGKAHQQAAQRQHVSFKGFHRLSHCFTAYMLRLVCGYCYTYQFLHPFSPSAFD